MLLYRRGDEGGGRGGRGRRDGGWGRTVLLFFVGKTTQKLRGDDRGVGVHATELDESEV